MATDIKDLLRIISGVLIGLLVIVMYLIYINSNGTHLTVEQRLAAHSLKPPQFRRPKLCTLDVVRDHLVRTGEFLGGGTWKKDQWWPEDCSMPKQLTPSELGVCLKKKQIKKIGIVGDSQSMRYFAAIKRGQGKFACKLSKSEGAGRAPTVNYYSPPLDNKSIRVASRDCNGCQGQLTRCSLTGQKATGSNIHTDIEVLIMEYTKDSEITTKRNYWKKECDERLQKINQIYCQESVATQEVYFREYWPLSGYPDVILIYAVHVHEAQKRRPRDFERDFTWFIDLIVSAAPKSTKIIYWNAPQVNSEKQPLFWRNITANSYVEQLNTISASVIKKIITEKNINNLYPMYDLYKMSDSVRNWIVDGVHLQGQWYNQVSSLFWTTLCAD